MLLIRHWAALTILGLLLQQSFHTGQDAGGLRAQHFALAIQLAVNIAPDSTDHGTQGFQTGLHASELLGMSVTSDLCSLPGRSSVVVLTQRDAQGVRQFHQILASPFEQATIGWASHGLFHHRHVDDDRLKTLCLDHLAPAGGFDDFCQQPLTPSSPARWRQQVIDEG